MNASFLANQDAADFGVLICGHGSRNKVALQEFEVLVSAIKDRLKGISVEYAYLEFAHPVLNEALDRLRDKKVKKVIAIPAMLFAAGHVKNDIPSVLKKYSEQTGLEVLYGRELGVDRAMIAAAGSRIKDVLDSTSKYPISETLLVVVGRGSSDPDANSNVSKITRMLVEGFGFGWGETVFSGVTFPLVKPGLTHIARIGFKRIIVFPYFLFSGVLIDRIFEHIELVASEHPDIEFLKAKYLGDQTFVVDTFLDRINETLQEENIVSCSLCKYRDSILGFENEVGLAQQSHHHHVEGLNDEENIKEHEKDDVLLNQELEINGFQNSHSGFHAHHYPYPHADHPLGPISLNNKTPFNPKEN